MLPKHTQTFAHPGEPHMHCRETRVVLRAGMPHTQAAQNTFLLASDNKTQWGGSEKGDISTK